MHIDIHVHTVHLDCIKLYVVSSEAFAMNINIASFLYQFLFFFAENVREFTCGKLYYRTFHLDEERDVLYVGAM